MSQVRYHSFAVRCPLRPVRISVKLDVYVKTANHERINFLTYRY
jgi:hypothetical protein